MSKQWKIAAALYATAGVVTFGHASAAAQRENDAFIKMCQIEGDAVRECFAYVLAPPLWEGLWGGALWPLYWSWEAWS